MAPRVVKWLQSWSAFWIFGIWFAAWMTAHFFPPSFWFTVRQVAVFNSIAGADIILDVDREIHRNFVADWAVLVRRHNGGQWTVICQAHGTSDYNPSAALPDPLTLDWWTGGECPTLDQGYYIMSTLWTIRGRYGLPNKEIQSLSNVFEIVGPRPRNRFQGGDR
jgi:hypothetical protein